MTNKLTKEQKLTAENMIGILNDVILKHDVWIIAMLEQISQTEQAALLREGHSWIRDLRNGNLALMSAIARLELLAKGDER